MATTNISWAKQQFMLKHPEKYGGLAKVRAIIYGNKSKVDPTVTGSTVALNQLDVNTMPDVSVPDTQTENMKVPKQKRRVGSLYNNT